MKKTALNQIKEKAMQASEGETTPAQRRKPAPKRILVPFVITEEARTQIRFLAAETNRTQQELFAEALNKLFKDYGKKQVA